MDEAITPQIVHLTAYQVASDIVSDGIVICGVAGFVNGLATGGLFTTLVFRTATGPSRIRSLRFEADGIYLARFAAKSAVGDQAFNVQCMCPVIHCMCAGIS